MRKNVVLFLFLHFFLFFFVRICRRKVYWGYFGVKKVEVIDLGEGPSRAEERGRKGSTNRHLCLTWRGRALVAFHPFHSRVQFCPTLMPSLLTSRVWLWMTVLSLVTTDHRCVLFMAARLVFLSLTVLLPTEVLSVLLTLNNNKYFVYFKKFHIMDPIPRLRDVC